MQHPIGIEWHEGELFIADTYNHKIKKVLPIMRSVQTVLGSGAMGLHDGASKLATFSEPSGLSFAVFENGRQPLLYIADTNNHAIRIADFEADEVRTLEITGLWPLGGVTLNAAHPLRQSSNEMEVCPAFIDETGVLSGSPRRQPVYGVAALVVPETKDITDTLYRRHFNFVSDRATERRNIRQAIRQRGQMPTLKEIDVLMHSTSHHEYKFTEASRFNIQQYIDLLNIYFTFPELQFHAMVWDRRAPDYSLARWNEDVWSAYAHLTRDLIGRRFGT